MSIEKLMEREDFVKLFINNNMSIIDSYDNLFFIADPSIPENSGLHSILNGEIYRIQDLEMIKLSFPKLSKQKVYYFIRNSLDTYRA